MEQDKHDEEQLKENTSKHEWNNFAITRFITSKNKFSEKHVTHVEKKISTEKKLDFE